MRAAAPASPLFANSSLKYSRPDSRNARNDAFARLRAATSGCVDRMVPTCPASGTPFRQIPSPFRGLNLSGRGRARRAPSPIGLSRASDIAFPDSGTDRNASSRITLHLPTVTFIPCVCARLLSFRLTHPGHRTSKEPHLPLPFHNVCSVQPRIFSFHPTGQLFILNGPTATRYYAHLLSTRYLYLEGHIAEHMQTPASEIRGRSCTHEHRLRFDEPLYS